ncbi:MAG: glutathione S-transferase family protein, partial [Myxococcota bacterium]
LIEAELEGDPYCLASGFSLADLYLALFCRWDLDAPGRLVRPRLEALMNAVKARPGAGKAWARHWGA